MPRYIDVTLDRPRRLRFDVNALEMLERSMGGAPLFEILGKIAVGGVHPTKTALWIALRHEDKNLTADRVGVLMQDFCDAGGTLSQLSDLLTEAVWASGIAKKDEEAPEQPADPPPATATT